MAPSATNRDHDSDGHEDLCRLVDVHETLGEYIHRPNRTYYPNEYAVLFDLINEQESLGEYVDQWWKEIDGGRRGQHSRHGRSREGKYHNTRRQSGYRSVDENEVDEQSTSESDLYSSDESLVYHTHDDGSGSDPRCQAGRGARRTPKRQSSPSHSKPQLHSTTPEGRRNNASGKRDSKPSNLKLHKEPP